MEKRLIIFLFTKFKAKKQNPNDQYKEVKSKPEMQFLRAVVVRASVLVRCLGP